MLGYFWRLAALGEVGVSWSRRAAALRARCALRRESGASRETIQLAKSAVQIARSPLPKPSGWGRQAVVWSPWQGVTQSAMLQDALFPDGARIVA